MKFVVTLSPKLTAMSSFSVKGAVSLSRKNPTLRHCPISRLVESPM